MQRRWIKGCVGLFAVLILQSVPVHASEADLREAYAAYQEAAAARDLYGALPHAQATYEAGLELYGPSHRNTGLLAFNYGYALNEVGRWEDATQIFQVSVDALRDIGPEAKSDLFESLYELGRAQRHIVGDETGDEALLEALSLGTELYGGTSEQVGLVCLELGRPLLQVEHNVPSHRSRVIIGSVYSHSEIRHSYLVRASEILSRIPPRRSEVAQIQVMQSLWELEQGDRRTATNMLMPAIEQLRQLRYADDTLVSIYLNWINDRSNGWSYRRKEEEIRELAMFAAMRREGEIHSLVRVLPTYPSSMARRSEEGTIMVAFTINEMGRPINVHVEEADPPGRMDENTLEAVSLAFFLPRMVDSQPAASHQVRYFFHFEMAP